LNTPELKQSKCLGGFIAMVRLDIISTRDGMHHESEYFALQHIEKMQGLELSKLAHAVIKAEKYSNICQTLENHKSTMSEILAWESDKVLERG